MLVIVSDTHGREGHRLEGRTLEAVREAGLVIHAGDYTTEAVLDAFLAAAGADPGVDRSGAGVADGDDRDFVGVYGNNDGAGIRGRLGATRMVQWAGARILVVHGHDHDEAEVGYLGRQEGADLVVVGHSHRPGVDRSGAVTTVNPGSHADPRWHRPAHAELHATGEGLRGRLVQPDAEVIGRFDLAVGGSA